MEKFILSLAFALFAVFVISIIIALPVMWLWNETLPELFGFKEIDFWMAFKVSLLASTLFKSHSSSSNKKHLIK